MEQKLADMLRLDNQLCFALYAASRKVTGAYGPLLKKLDLTYTQYVTLMVLWEQQELPVKDIGERLLLDSGTLTPLLKKLEEKGYVTRRRSTVDERVVQCGLPRRAWTSSGRSRHSCPISSVPSAFPQGRLPTCGRS